MSHIGRRELKETTMRRYITEGNAIWWMDEHGVDVYFTTCPPWQSEYPHYLPREYALGVRSPNTGLITFEWFSGEVSK